MTTTIHICGGDETPESLAAAGVPISERLRPAVTGWVSSPQRWPRRTHRRWLVIVDCCNRRVHLHTTEAHLSIAYSGYVSEWRFRCAPSQGCTVKVWECKIGWGDVSGEADVPMRRAVAEAFRQLTGHEPQFIFSGWGGRLSEAELAVVEDRLPRAADAKAGSDAPE